MDFIEQLVKTKDLSLNNVYNSYEINKKEIIIKKSKRRCSSTIETKELINLFDSFDNISNVDFEVLENGDIVLRERIQY